MTEFYKPSNFDMLRSHFMYCRSRCKYFSVGWSSRVKKVESLFSLGASDNNSWWVAKESVRISTHSHVLHSARLSHCVFSEREPFCQVVCLHRKLNHLLHVHIFRSCLQHIQIELIPDIVGDSFHCLESLQLSGFSVCLSVNHR